MELAVTLVIVIIHAQLFFFLSDVEAQREFDEKQELNNIERNRYEIV